MPEKGSEKSQENITEIGVVQGSEHFKEGGILTIHKMKIHLTKSNFLKLNGFLDGLKNGEKSQMIELIVNVGISNVALIFEKLAGKIKEKILKETDVKSSS